MLTFTLCDSPLTLSLTCQFSAKAFSTPALNLEASLIEVLAGLLLLPPPLEVTSTGSASLLP